MIKQTNPFYTINEAYAILKHLGVDPNKGPNNPCATYAFPWGDSYGAKVEKSEEPIYWQEHVLGMMVRREYVGGTHYYVLEIHLDAEGFDRVCSLIEASADEDEIPVLCIGPHSDEYDVHYIDPGTQLRLYKLVPKEVRE